MTNQIADYQLIRELGQGNYGVFYLARPPARLPIQDEFVAVKIFGSGTRVNPTTFRRAVTELKAFGAVRSPYLVRLYDAGQERGVFYYAMEYLPRGSLADPADPPSRDDNIRAVEHAARAAHDLHEAGIVHRDIKPGNILMHDKGGRLSDLGLAQVLAPGLTVTSLGGLKSLEYLDPAVLNGGRPSRTSDVWSLGVSLHFALTGRGIYPKFPDKDVVLAMRTVASTPPVIDPRLSPDESAIVRACLTREPSQRPATALEVAEKLRRASSAGL
jgi:serine/threonine protein kinase